MAAPIPRFQTGDTRQFSIVYSVAPGTTPLFTVRQGSGIGTLVYSTSAASSSSTAWFAFHTLTSCERVHTAEWVASYTNGPVVNRDFFKPIRHVPG